MKMPVVCANIIQDETGEPYFKPYTVLKTQGIRIAVLGLLTPMRQNGSATHKRRTYC